MRGMPRCAVGLLGRPLLLNSSARSWTLTRQGHAASFRSFSSSVPAALVKQLRDRTGASMGKCREALSQEAGDVEKAVQWLKKRGVRSMEKRAAEAGEALLALSSSSAAGAIVELRAETDFVTRGELFQRIGLCLASVAARHLLEQESLLEAEFLPDRTDDFKQVAPGTPVSAALLELGSVLGERLVLGQVLALQAPKGGAVAGYVHPKQADGLLGTGRLASLVAVRPVPTDASNPSQLEAVAAKLARHAVAAQPRFLSRETVPVATLEKEREAFREAHAQQIGEQNASKLEEHTWKKVLDGKTQRFYQDTVLMCQELVTPGSSKPVPVAEWLEAEARASGLEKLVVDDFRLLSLG